MQKVKIGNVNSNKVAITGNLTRDLEVGYTTQKGVPIAKGTLAHNPHWDKERVIYVDFTLFPNDEDLTYLSETYKKGVRTIISGHITQDVERKRYEVCASEISTASKKDTTNTVSIVGNLTKDPETKEINGRALTVLRIANNNPKKTAVVYLTVSVWNGLAELVADSVKKGDAVYVKGELSTTSYKTKEGKWANDYKVSAHQIYGVDWEKDQSTIDETPTTDDTPADETPAADVLGDLL